MTVTVVNDVAPEAGKVPKRRRLEWSRSHSGEDSAEYIGTLPGHRYAFREGLYGAVLYYVIQKEGEWSWARSDGDELMSDVSADSYEDAVEQAEVSYTRAFEAELRDTRREYAEEAARRQEEDARRLQESCAPYVAAAEARATAAEARAHAAEAELERLRAAAAGE